MDLGTFETLKIGDISQKCNDILYDASGTQMDIIGVAKITVNVVGTNKKFTHDFRILNNRLFSNVILGRDIMKKFKRVTFDFQSNTLSFDGRQIKGVALPRQKVAVRVQSVSLIPLW